ncbi:hypothetical protein MBLNU459_g7500t2 [Dothideomycetes sp. NU459]
MGTLTADIPRLPDYCDHKLPTSCRLTSIPRCCACADERAHSASYATYIDGIGFVPRGTRWQRYCWFCKEFWENRVAATNLRPAQTRIPENPDQSDFLQRWYEFHRGYRIVTRQDGTEERVAVLGEPFKDVSPGQLPRTLDELRAGRERSLADQQQQQQHVAVEDDDAADAGPSLEDTLDNMFAAAEAEESPLRATPAQPTPPTEHSQPSQQARVAGQAMRAFGSRNREYQERRIAALRRELYRMRNGIERVISGLRELGEMVPDSRAATERLTSLGRTLDVVSASQPPFLSGNATADIVDRAAPAPPAGHVYRDSSLASIQQRFDEAQRQLQQAQTFRDQSARDLQAAQANFDVSETDLAEHREQLSRLRREQRTAENYTRIFGTREDMEREGAEYESPIGGMFTRAYERFRVAEEVRREERLLRDVLEDELRAGAQLSAQIPDETPAAANTTHEDQLNEYYTMLRQQDWMQRPTAGSDSANFPTNMLNALRSNSDRESRGTESPSVTAGVTAPQVERETTSPAPAQTPRPTQLERLLRNTPEPQRSAIIARMTENGTAQALEESAARSDFSPWRRLVESHPGLPPPSVIDRDSEAESEDEENRGEQGLDAPDTGRPEPKEDDEMLLKLDCKRSA